MMDPGGARLPTAPANEPVRAFGPPFPNTTIPKQR